MGAVALLLALALGLAPACRAETTADPAQVLLEFAAAARGSGKDAALTDWRPGTDPCTWTGVRCSGGAVTTLRLPRAGLRGTLDPGLARLATLQRIDLSDNALRGRLPARWARLDALERLHLDRNQLSGPLPPTWNTMEALQYLSLTGNALNGSLPVAWASLGQLYSLDLSGNRLQGPLPPQWARQRWLFRLDASRNVLSGPLPPQWGRLRALLQLNLGGNRLTGGLPPAWGELRQATAIDLSANQLAGPLPAQWAGLASLQVLALQGNQLSGAVPSQWAALATRAYRLSMGSNSQLCGAVPQPLAQAALAAGTSAAGSGLGAPCPWQADAEALLDFKAGIVGAPAGALVDWAPDAGNPCSEGAWTGVRCHDGRVVALDLSGMGLQMASLEPLSRLGAVEQLLLAGNSAPNATLPASWAALSRLVTLDLSGAGLGGALSPEWAALASLKQLRLRGNSLEGALPPGWSQMASLEELDLSQNALIGSLPPDWGALPSLAALDVSANYLSSGLPETWASLASLRELRLSSNNLGGAIPASWARLPSLALLDLDSNVGLCGAQPNWRDGIQVDTEATNLGQSCIMVHTSGMVAGAVLGVSVSMTVASVAAAAALLVFVRRQRAQLAVLQREKSAASFSTFPSFDYGAAGSSFGSGGPFVDKLSHQLHTFSAAGAAPGGIAIHVAAGSNAAAAAARAAGARLAPAERVKALQIPNPWADDQGGYIQVPAATPHSSLPAGPARTPPRAGIPSAGEDEHRSPSPRSAMPSPDRHQWQVAVQAAERGVDLTARRSHHKRLFRSRSDAPASLAAAAASADMANQQQHGELIDRRLSSDEAGLQMARVHSRMMLLPPGSTNSSSMV